MAAKKQYTAFQWKCFMAFLMVLDHLPYIPGLVPPTVTGIFHVLTRCVGVWFAYLAVEGFLHTKSRVRYMARLFVWAGIMALGNALYNTIGASRGLHLSNNIFLTLALGVLMLNILVGSNPATQWGVRPRSAGEWTLRLFGVILVLAASLFSEGGILILPFLLITICAGNGWSCAMYSILRCPLCCFFWFLSLTPQRRRPCKCWHLTRTFCLLRSCPSFLIMMAHEGLTPREASTFSMCFTLCTFG